MNTKEFIACPDDYRIGNKIVDTEHQFLFSLFQDLDDLISSENEGKDRIIRAVQRLLDYSRIHFRSEEEIMFLSKYEHYESHRCEHKKFIKNVEELLRFVTEDIPICRTDAVLLMKRDFIQHFHNEDSDLAKIAS